MSVVKLSQTGVGSTGVYQVDYMQRRVLVGVQCVVTGTVTYSLQYTNEDVSGNDFDPDLVAWFSPTNVTNITSNSYFFIAFPLRGIRVIVSSGTGTVTAIFCQAGVG